MDGSGTRNQVPDLTGSDLPEPRFTGRINFPRYRKLTVFDPDLQGKTLSPEHSAVNRGPTVDCRYTMVHDIAMVTPLQVYQSNAFETCEIRSSLDSRFP